MASGRIKYRLSQTKLAHNLLCKRSIVPASALAGHRKAPHANVSAGRSQPDLPPSRREITAVCIGCCAILVAFAGLIAYDARVISWVSDAAQAEFVTPNPTVVSQPVQLAVRKAIIN